MKLTCWWFRTLLGCHVVQTGKEDNRKGFTLPVNGVPGLGMGHHPLPAHQNFRIVDVGVLS